MKHEKINGEWFEVSRPRKYKPQMIKGDRWTYTGIYAAYDHPSVYKVCIWDEWCNFTYHIADECPFTFGQPWITSRNTFSFTVAFNVYDRETGDFAGVAVITRDHNRLFLL